MNIVVRHAQARRALHLGTSLSDMGEEAFNSPHRGSNPPPLLWTPRSQATNVTPTTKASKPADPDTVPSFTPIEILSANPEYCAETDEDEAQDFYDSLNKKKEDG